MTRVMERELADILPIWGMEKGCMVSKMGDYTAAFAVTKPEIFTLFCRSVFTLATASSGDDVFNNI